MKPIRITFTLILLTLAAHAAEVVQYDPVYSSTIVLLDTELINNDNGAIYESASFAYFALLPNGSVTNLATAIQQLPQNLTNTLAGVQEAWTGGVLPGISEVDTGWSMTLQPDASYSIENSGGRDYDTWQNTAADANQDMMYLSHKIPLEQLDGNGDGWRTDDPDDWQIVLTEVVVDGFVGQEGVTFYQTGGFPDLQGVPKAYTLIPNRPPPVAINTLDINNTNLTLSLSNLTYSVSNRIEQTSNLTPPNWQPVTSLISTSLTDQLNIALTNTTDRLYFRVVSE